MREANVNDNILKIQNILATAFNDNFSEYRFPYTYHHDYGRLADSRYEDLSRRDIAELLDEIEDPDQHEYELVSYATFYLISSYPEAFRLAIASEDDSFWHLLQSLRTFDSYSLV